MTSMAPSTAALFSLFPLLPAELRLRIWWFAAARSRIIFLSRVLHSIMDFDVTSTHPVILYVNHESRSVALGLYELYTVFARNRDGHVPKLQKGVWIDLRADTLFFTHDPASIMDFEIRKMSFGAAEGDDAKGKGKAMDVERKARQDRNEVDKVHYIAFPYNTLRLDVSMYHCGTGIMQAIQQHSEDVQEIEVYLASLPLLQSAILVVDMKKERAEQQNRIARLSGAQARNGKNDTTRSTEGEVGPAKEEVERPVDAELSELDMELIPFKVSERCPAADHDDICKQVESYFGDDAPREPEIGCARIRSVVIMEAHRRETPDFTYVPAAEDEAIRRRVNTKAIFGDDVGFDSSWVNLGLVSGGKEFGQLN